jgi:4-amino-4-deoxy-L-arabinose transferase-like glycosyltransferase
MKKLFHSEQFPILALLVIILVTGLITLTNYGESWDELQFYKYADHALASYGTWLQSAQIIVTGNTYDNYGPAFVMFTALVARGLHTLDPNGLISDFRHLVYFLTFVAGIYAFYLLARRWMSVWAAFAATLLFAAQPVFWGHAFISPKDIPFLSAFLVSLLLGLRMADSQPVLNGRMPRALIWITSFWVLSLLFLFFTPQILDNGLSVLIRNAFSQPESFFGAAFRNLSSSFGRTKPDVYIERALVAVIWLKLIYLLISAILLGLLYRKQFPEVFKLFRWDILLAGLALGLTVSIRILGPLVGLLVAIYAWQKMGKRSLPVLFVYAGLALAVMLVTWPYLWPDPPARLVESLRVMSQYPWTGKVFFDGGYYASQNLPRSYLPVLLAIQITEPVWPLFFLSLALLWKNKYLLISTLLWFVLPLAALVASRSPLYDNFRQVIFILPPVFFVCGLGLDWLFQRLRAPVVRGVIVAALALPGILAGIQLHPYEYIYYNSFIGGERGAQGRFEMDYWATSYRAAMNYVNGVAPANGKIIAAGPSYIAAIYARRDLRVYMDSDINSVAFDYAIITTRYSLDQTDLPDAQVVYTIEREGVPLTVIKKVR